MASTGNKPLKTEKGSAPRRLARPDVWSAVKYAVISAVSIVPAALLANANEIAKAAVAGAIAAACGTVIKIVQRYLSDTR